MSQFDVAEKPGERGTLQKASSGCALMRIKVQVYAVVRIGGSINSHETANDRIAVVKVCQAPMKH